MSIQRLITDHLDTWATAVRDNKDQPELTGLQKLRELILELAVRGQLVPQDPTDEPANELLDRVWAEKRRLYSDGFIKKPTVSSPLADADQSFAIPGSWAWTRLQEIGHQWGQKSPDKPFSYIDVSSIDNTKGKVTHPVVLSPEEAPSRARKLVREGTVIYSTVRPYLQNNAVIETEPKPEPIVSTAFAVINPLGGINPRYVLYYLRSPSFVSYVESVQAGVAYPAINDRKFFDGVIPIPPVEEQHRIVARVDEIMALCDRLEQQTHDQLEAHETLVDSLLETLTQSADAKELAGNWARLAEHFDILFSNEYSITRLEQTIVNLAFMGRLTHRSSSDQPPSDRLAQITAEKERLVREGHLREAALSSRAKELRGLFPLKEGWIWRPLEDLFGVITDGDHQPPPKTENGIPFCKRHSRRTLMR